MLYMMVKPKVDKRLKHVLSNTHAYDDIPDDPPEKKNGKQQARVV
jgi:hypothetical protein